MSKDNDYAILVGISRYGDSSFRPLDGPPNDVQRMREWLLSPTGGDLPPNNVVVLTSPKDIPTDPNDWQPDEAQYNKAFRRLVQDPNTGAPVRRTGRLYLYFSGHGFSERRDQATRAAIFAANATRFFPNNICGTIYAQSAKEQALFKEIVLIMDCCRDAELNLPFSQPAINASTAETADGVRFLAIYAAPKGGKAQERPFAELSGKTCGLLTHALLKAWSEAPADGVGTVSATAVKRYIQSTWASLCGDTPAAEPEFLLPTGQDIQFPAVAQGVMQTFAISNAAARQFMVDISDGAKKRLVRCVFGEGEPSVQWTDRPALPLPVAAGRFQLRLQPGFYRCEATGDIAKSSLFEADGVSDVIL